MTKLTFEGGFTRIPNGLLETMMHYPSSGLKKDILLFLIRYSYGYQRNSIEVSVKEISENLNRPKNKVCIALKDLIGDKIVEVVRCSMSSRKPRVLSLNTDCEQWNIPDRPAKKLQVTKRSADDQKATGTDDQKVTSAGYQKVTGNPSSDPVNKEPEASPKKYLKKEKKVYSPDSEEFRLSKLLLSLIKQRREKFRQPDLLDWCTHVDRLIRLDKREPKEIVRVIRWCQNDKFWYQNILSTESLRKQYDRLAIAMDGETGRNNSGIKNITGISESDRIRL